MLEPLSVVKKGTSVTSSFTQKPSACKMVVNVCPTWPAKIPLRPMMTRMLKTAEPTIVPTPTSPLVMKTAERRGRGEKRKSVFGFVWFQIL